MEKIYPPNRFGCSQPVPLEEYFGKFTKKYNAYKNLSRKLTENELIDSILYSLKASEEKAENLKELCSKYAPVTTDANLVKKRERIKKTPAAIAEGAKAFHVVRTRLKYQDELKSMREKQIEDKDTYTYEMTPHKSKSINIQSGREFAVSIRVYYPFEWDFRANSYTKIKFSHEIIVLGSHTLADLRDKISCRADLGLCTEVDNPNAELSAEPAAKEKYPSGFIFIDNVFYNDMRHANAQDNSEVIRKWANKVNIQTLSVGDMKETQIADLSPRFGYPYVYQHQGNCEHVLSFSNAWLLSEKDNLNVNDYPYIKTAQRLRTKHCILCYKLTAKWICYDCDRLPHAEAFVCQKCLLDYCYKDGKKKGTFKLYPYYDESCPL